MMQRMKQGLAQAGIKPKKEVYTTVDKGIENKRLPVSRMIGRLGIKEYDVPAPLHDNLMEVSSVKIPLRMHIGAPAVPVVSQGQQVNRGELIADIKEGALGAKIHASISGTVTAVNNDSITIEVK